jgi:hypothetical protein
MARQMWVLRERLKGPTTEGRALNVARWSKEDAGGLCFSFYSEELADSVDEGCIERRAQGCCALHRHEQVYGR